MKVIYTHSFGLPHSYVSKTTRILTKSQSWARSRINLLARRLQSWEARLGTRTLVRKCGRGANNKGRIGFGAAEAFADAGAIVTILSSSQEKVDDAVRRLNSPNVTGLVANVRDEKAFTDAIVSLAPLDHLVFSSVDKIIRGPLADADLDEAKHLFGVKFWGSIIVGKSERPDIIPSGAK